MSYNFSPKQQSDLRQKPVIYIEEIAPRSDISIEEAKVFSELRKDKSRVILTVEKGVAMVVMDKHDYISRAHDLLAEKDAYRLITGDPTTKCKNKLIQILRTIKPQGGLSNITYKRLSHRCSIPHILWTPRVHIHGIP